MKSFAYRTRLALDDLAIVERPVPSLDARGVLVRVDAASLNYRDLAIARGVYGALPVPLVPLSDAAGEVIATGPEVTRFAVGDRVAAAYVPEWRDGPVDDRCIRGRLGGPLDGVLSEVIAVDESALVHAPKGWNAVDTATLPVAAVSAWQALITDGGVRAGDDVGIVGTGAAALFAVMIARSAGARAIVVGRDPARLERIEAMGATIIDTTSTPGWDERMRALTDGRGVDHLLDAVGGDDLDRAVAATRVGGVVNLFGFAAGTRAQLDLVATIRRVVTLRATSGGSTKSFEGLVRAIDSGAPIRPVIARVVAFDDAPLAFAHLANGRPFGKVVIATTDASDRPRWGLQAPPRTRA